MEKKIAKQTYESLEDFAKEIKAGKVIKIFFQISVKQQEVSGVQQHRLPDGTTEELRVPGARMTAEMTVSGVSPSEVGASDQQAYLTQYLYSQPIAVADCYNDENYATFNEAVKSERDKILGDIQKMTSVILFPGNISLG